MTLSLVVIGGVMIGVGLAKIFGSFKEHDESMGYPHYWICGKTFPHYKGLYYHHRATHDDPMSALIPKKDGPYRSLP